MSTTPSPPATRPPLLSIELFQRRHVEEFAHLHSDADAALLAIERDRLEEERRRGRERRQTREVQKFVSTRSASVDRAPGKGTRPLSLLQKRTAGHTRSKTADVGLGYGLGLGLQKGYTGPGRAVPGERRNSLNGNGNSLRPLTLRSSVVSPVSTDSSRERESGGLEVLIERDGSPEPESSSEANTSLTTNQSTYSWATSFSGETTELRTAAHYVTSADPAEEEVEEAADVDSPARKTQRRKRIVAIAHTVRQLEGVGSRDLEDPTFYYKLQKAWYARFDDSDKPHKLASDQESPPLLSPTPYTTSPIPPYAPGVDQSASTARYPPALTGQELSSPPDPEFRTPQDYYQAPFGGNVHHGYPRPESAKTYGSMRSDSVRYSYASSLHDLGIDAYTQGEKLMREKPWLRPRSTVGTPWGGDFSSSPPFRSSTPEEPEEEDEDENEETDTRVGGSTRSANPLGSPFEYGPPPLRTLRRTDGNVTRVVPMQTPPPSAAQETFVQRSVAGPSNWGLGLGKSWWSSSSASASPEARPDTAHSNYTQSVHGNVDDIELEEEHASDARDQDFHQGENGNIPHTHTRDSPRRHQWMTTSRTSSAVLEPERSNNQRVDRPRRHSYPTHTSHPHWLDCPQKQRRSDPIESAYWNRYQPIFTLTPSTTSAPFHERQKQRHQRSRAEEDGLTGSERSLRRSRSMSNPGKSPLGSLPSPYLSSMRTTRDPLPDEEPESAETEAEQWEAGVVLPLPSALLPAPLISRPDGLVSSIEIVEQVPRAPIQLSLPTPPPVIPTRTTSRHRGCDSLSYPHWSNDIALPVGARDLVDIRYAAGPQPMTAMSLRGPGSQEQAEVGMGIAMKERRQSGRLPTIMFFLGFVMPLLWIVGGWSMPRRQVASDIEKGGVGVGQVDGREERMPWWRRWAYHPDLYVQRCRRAAAVSVPLCAAGATAGILVGVLT